MFNPPVPSVVANKLLVPRLRPETIARDRLTRLLEATSEHPLTVLCAPAGYGKTTALVEWLVSADRSTAWLSLDGRDNDPQRLCTHLLAAVDRICPMATIDAERALVGGSDLVDTVAP